MSRPFGTVAGGEQYRNAGTVRYALERKPDDLGWIPASRASVAAVWQRPWQRMGSTPAFGPSPRSHLATGSLPPAGGYIDGVDPIAPKPSRFSGAIGRLSPGRLQPADVCRRELLLVRDGPLEVYYAPFEGLNPDARVVLVGICPSLGQAARALEIARDWLAEGGDRAATAATVARRLPFNGMRRRLVKLLDAVGLPAALGLPPGTGSDAITGSQTGLVQATAAIRYPVVVSGRNYDGWRPVLSRHPLLARYLRERLAPELETMPGALVVPLGTAVAAGLRELVAAGRLDPDRCLFGFPHPSGANAARVAAFDELAGPLARRARAWLMTSDRGSG